jgi:hypothetical protein
MDSYYAKQRTNYAFVKSTDISVQKSYVLHYRFLQINIIILFIYLLNDMT